MLKHQHFSTVGTHVSETIVSSFFSGFGFIWRLGSISKSKKFRTLCLYPVQSEVWKMCNQPWHISAGGNKEFLNQGFYSFFSISFNSQWPFWRPNKFTQMLLEGAALLQAEAARLNCREENVYTNSWIMTQVTEPPWYRRPRHMKHSNILFHTAHKYPPIMSWVA